MSVITTHDKIFTLQTDETLLEALERTGHQVEYQCRSGYCGLCRLKLLAGQVSYASQPLAFIGPDEILPCCCQVITDLTIDCKISHEAALSDIDLFQ
ncbi:class I ribonucleotide reductase maintenance protein YfaE [Neisseriaceae bacterium ESL0693]|nr:class I ribonucleotide reductase maintenance protein YfaE [Neisseriaceae bacterium ESL0693]